jgi:hypothetical protein
MVGELRKNFDLDRDLAQPIEQAEKFEGEIGQMLYSTLLAGLSAIEQQVIARTPVNFGHLRGSITRGEIVRHGRSLEGDVRTPSPYGLPVERGRKAGKWPPRDAIELWVVRKGLAQAGTREAGAIAFLIARAIGQGRSKGTANVGAHMFEEGLAAAEPEIERLFSELLDDVVGFLATAGG